MAAASPHQGDGSHASFSTDSFTAFPVSFSAVTVVFYQMQRSAVALDTAA